MASTEVLPTRPKEAFLTERFRAVRATTAALTARLTAEDQMVQSCADASPVKWHLAHSTWFFETFVLREFSSDYRPFEEDFLRLFNSYYKSLGPHPEKRLRASFSRPSLEQVLAYRQHVEEAVEGLQQAGASDEALGRIELGLHHEQQHQELIVTDIKHAFWSNPLQPVYAEPPLAQPALSQHTINAARQRWFSYAGGLVKIGHSGDDFSFDNELSCHRVYLEPFQLASRLVTCAEYFAFMEDQGYQRPELWLSDGWEAVQAHNWNGPLYWQLGSHGAWDVFTLHGVKPLEELLTTPVCHLSYYEADAYARWSGHRLPTEFEWEHAASKVPISGNFLESGALDPVPASNAENASPAQIFGDVWEWTQSAYTAYPRYRPAAGALGEYNGKFMCNQLILRGGSAATPISHIRVSYRNFFPPATRWQFSGLRLASDGESA